MRRRSVVLSIGLCSVLVVAFVAGPLSMDAGTRDGTPTGTTAVGTPGPCDGDEVRPDLELPGGRLPERAGGIELSASAGTVRSGHRITFSLTNVDDERRTTGTSKLYAVQRRVGNHWRTVTLFRTERMGFNATAIVHSPGTAFSWSFRASAAGFTRGKYVVCHRLPAGAYRFVYAGTDPPLAVRFEIAA